MQVWSTRKRAAEEAPKAVAKGGSQPASSAWALRVLAGVHAGAERKLQESSFLMVGSSDDCDLIFADVGVAPHHCIVTRSGGELSVRAVDAEVRIDDRVLHPGDPQEIKPFSVLRIGNACFALGPHWSERWQTLLSQIEPTPRAAGGEQSPPRQRSGRGVTLGVALVLMGASAGALLLAQNNAKPPPTPVATAARDGELRTLIEGFGYKGLRVNARSDGRLIVNGYVERSEDLTNLRTQLDQRGFKADIEAKSGPRIAEDVAEQFRMSKLHAKTEWKGDGHVLARGRFGDETAVMAFLGSRTMRDFNESLKLKIDLQNLDTPPPEEKTIPEGKRIRQIVDNGPDSYLISVDKSLYYVGAKLPRGGTFIGIEYGEVLVRDDAGNLQRLPRESVIDATTQ